MIVDVYNARGALARSVLARAGRNNIIVTQLECLAVVDIPDDESGRYAFFEPGYNGPGKVNRPYMTVQGSVSELFMEPTERKTFPCGADRLMIKNFKDGEPDPIPVRINWLLSSDELSYLYSIGLGYPDFKPPVMLRGNKLEIPLNIIYKACYDSPFCAVDIVNALHIDTSTKYNHYDTVFMNCDVSQQLLYEKENGGIDIEFNIDKDIPIIDFQAEDVSDTIDITNDELVVSDKEPVLTEDEKDTRKFSAELESKMQRESDRYADQKSHERPYDGSGVLAEMQDDIRREEDDDVFDNNDDTKAPSSGALRLSDRMNMLKEKVAKHIGDSSDDNAQGQGVENDGVITDMTNYDSVEEESSGSGSDRKKSEKDAARQRAINRNIDVARDNMALNAGIDDISGFGADVSGDDEKTKTEAAHDKAEREADEQRDNVRRVDNALDNKAINNGATDTAGFGADNAEKPKANNTAKRLLDGVFKRRNEAAAAKKRGEEVAIAQNTSDDNPNNNTNGPESRFL